MSTKFIFFSLIVITAVLMFPERSMAWQEVQMTASTTPGYVCTTLPQEQYTPDYANYQWIISIPGTSYYTIANIGGQMTGGATGGVTSNPLCLSFSATDNNPYYLVVNAKLNDPGAGQHTINYLSVPIRGDSDGNLFIDDATTTTSTLECSTCTRIIDRNPDIGETVASTTKTVSITYYVNEDDFCSNLLCQTQIKIAVNPPLSTEKYIFIQNVSLSGTNYIAHTFTDIVTATGTVTTEIEIFNDYVVIPDRTILWDIYKWYKGEANTDAEVNAFASSTRAINWETINNLEAGSEDLGSTDNPGVFARLLKDTVSDFLHLPPWGYVYVFNETLQNPTTTSVALSMTHTIPTGMPGEGASLTLDAQSGASSSIAMLRSLNISSIDGDVVDYFIYYWNMLWYLMFIIWLMKEVPKFVK